MYDCDDILSPPPPFFSPLHTLHKVTRLMRWDQTFKPVRRQNKPPWTGLVLHLRRSDTHHISLPLTARKTPTRPVVESLLRGERNPPCPTPTSCRHMLVRWDFPLNTRTKQNKSRKKKKKTTKKN